jgi:thiol-disulfide isomerase/thioredoxin
MKSILYMLCGLVLLAALVGCEQPLSPAVTPHYPWEAAGRHVVAFKSETCPPCKAQRPQLMQLEKQGIDVHEVDVYEQREIADEYDVRRVPEYLVFENGVQIERVQSVTALLIALKALMWILSILL